MSVLKPVAKKAKTMGMSETKIAPSTVERSLPTSSHEGALSTNPTEMKDASVQTESDSNGHKSRKLASIWALMDSQPFLHLTDTLPLMDVWIQPTRVTRDRGSVAKCCVKQVVVAPHLKYRDAETKFSTDDITKLLYLNDKLQAMMQGLDALSFDDWLNEKSSLCVKEKGMEASNDRATLCDYIINEDPSFSFYPLFLKGSMGFFFRKICYHSYKCEESETKVKLDNPSMIKCRSSKGKFEYVLEARLLPLPQGWFDTASEVAEVPESQPV